LPGPRFHETVSLINQNISDQEEAVKNLSHTIVAFAFAAVLLSACGSEGRSSNSSASTARAEASKPAGPSALVSSGVPTGVGPIAVDETGVTLYVFSKDLGSGRKPTCYGRCAKVWAPYRTAGPPKVYEGTKARPALLGTVRRRDGAKQVTYAGYPLYLFLGEPTGALDHLGAESFGGHWYVVGVNGKINRG
jgi:predicted lipoprotein with Yx(FWY)xxD motif